MQSVVYDYRASGLSTVQSLDYSYYPDGLRASMTWSNGSVVVGVWNYTYDPGGRLTGVRSPWNETTGFGYDGEGKLTSQTNANGTSVVLAYNDARGWPTSLTYSAQGVPFAAYALSYDNGANTVGNLTGVTELDGSTVSYGYDALYRLVGATRTGTAPLLQSFDYDLAGNLTTANGSLFATYDAANKIASLPGGSAGYDGDGNLTGVSGTNVPSGSFTWNDLSRLTSQTAGGVTSSYGYNAGGQRVWSQVGAGGRMLYVFDGDLLLGEVQANGTVSAAYTWGASGLISERLVGQSKSLWYAFGPQGETRQLTDGKIDAPFFCDAIRYRFGTDFYVGCLIETALIWYDINSTDSVLFCPGVGPPWSGSPR